MRTEHSASSGSRPARPAGPLTELVRRIREGRFSLPNEDAFHVFYYDTKLGHLVEPFQEGDVLIVLTPTEPVRDRLMAMVRTMELGERYEPIRFFTMRRPHQEAAVNRAQRGLLELAWLLALEDHPIDSLIGSVLVDHLRTVGLERIAPEHRAAIGVALAQRAGSVQGNPVRR